MNMKALLSLKTAVTLPVDTAQHPRRRWVVGGGGLIGHGPQIRSPRRWQLQRMPKRRKNLYSCTLSQSRKPIQNT